MKKVRLTVSVNDAVFFIGNSKTFYFCITSKGARWTADLSSGETIEGIIKNETAIPNVSGAWACLAIPLKVQVKDSGHYVDLIVNVPDNVRVIVRQKSDK
jgi:hypothetical protein